MCERAHFFPFFSLKAQSYGMSVGFPDLWVSLFSCGFIKLVLGAFSLSFSFFHFVGVVLFTSRWNGEWERLRFYLTASNPVFRTEKYGKKPRKSSERLSIALNSLLPSSCQCVWWRIFVGIAQIQPKKSTLDAMALWINKCNILFCVFFPLSLVF